MSDVSQGAAVEGEAPVNPYSLLEAVNASSASAHTSWLIFIGVVSYLLVTVAGVSHRDLLIAGELALPLLQVGIDLPRFFLLVPFVVVLFHVGFILQLVTLARKALEFDKALRILEATDRRTHPLRLELGNFFLVQAIAGPQHSRIVTAMMHGFAWLTVIVMPVVALLSIQVAFLPYHDETITLAHRAAVAADIAFLGLIGVFLTRPDPTFAAALSRVSRRHPLSVIVALALAGGATGFAFLVATIPGERLDRVSRSLSWAGSDAVPFGTAPRDGATVPVLAGSADDKLLGLFARNLNVTDLNLVPGKDVRPGSPTLNLRHRDLRYARLDRTDLQQADLTGARLDGASLVGADLRGAMIGCAHNSGRMLVETREAADCASARRAIFTKARLADATLTGLDFAGARLEGADLRGASVSHVNLVGANLDGARLEKADLTGGVSLQGANLSGANLQGADLTGARMQGADLTNAALQAVVMDFASLEGAVLRAVDLEGASLYRARLLGADMTGARIRAASLREAWVWRASVPENSDSDLADLVGLRSEPPTRVEFEGLDRELKHLPEWGGVGRLRAALAVALAGSDESAAAERSGASSAAWADLIRASERANSDTVTVIGSLVPTGGVVSPEPPDVARQAVSGGLTAQLRLSDRRARLTRHLVLVACRQRWADGGVATGVVRRALGPAFNGDPGVLLDGLRRPDCAAVGSIPPSLLVRLANSVEGLRAR